jgi:cholesterol transport system auxiliary component
MMFMPALRVLVCALGLGATACALMSKGEPLTPRYFSLPEASTEPERPATGPTLSLRLGQVEAATHLEERMAYRVSASELGYYGDRRWTEPPEAYLRRELTRELFERRGLRHIVSGPAPTLDVDLVGFEQLRYGGERARVALRFTLYDERQALLESGVGVEQPLSEQAEPTAVAVALSGALTQAVRELATLVVAELAEAQQGSQGANATPAHSE